MDTEILKYILSCQGSVDREELECNLGGASFIAEMIDSNDKLVPCSFNGTPKVVARSRVRLCRAKKCPGCGGLHLCKNVLFTGVCPFQQTRRGCSFSHELHSEYNMDVLREFGLEALSRTELCLLLLQSNHTLLPQICHDYNNGVCQDDCQRLHVCELYLRFDCNCPRTHDFTAPQPLKLLQEKHIPDHLMKVLKSVYANKEALRLADKENGSNNSQAASDLDVNNENELNEKNQDITEDKPMDWSPYDSDASSSISAKQDQSSVQVTKKKRTRGRKRTKQKNKMPAAATGAELANPGHGQSVERSKDPNTTAETCGCSSESSSTSVRGSRKDGGNGSGDTICMFFIRGNCKHGDSCLKAHDKMPYRWQLKQGPFWIPLTQNETVEEDYCDPHNTVSHTDPSVHFERMKSGQNKVRRLSTVSSVVKPNYNYTTHWIWYWEDEIGQWHQYTPNERGLLSITSKELEQEYVKNSNDVVTFTADSQLFELNFRDMIERNLTYGSKRAVRRRPRFVSEAEVNKNRKCTTNITAVSDVLDKMQIAQKGPTHLLLSGAQLTTTASTINQLFNYISIPPANLAPTPQVAFTTTAEKLAGLSNFQTPKPANAVSLANVQVTSAQKTKVQAAMPMTTATTTTSAVNSALITTSSSQVPFTTEIQATKSPTSQFTSASRTGRNLTTDFSTTPSISGLKSPMETTTSATKSQMGFSISKSSAFEFVSPMDAKLATSGSNTASAFSTSTKSSNPLSPTLSAGKSQLTPITSATAQSQFKSSAASTSGLKSSNQFSTNSDSEYSKLTTTKSQFPFETTAADLKPSKSLPMTSQATKSQFTSTFETTAALKSTSVIASELKSTNQSSKSLPMTSQATKSQFTSTFETTAALKSTSVIASELKSTNQSSKSLPITSQATKSQFTFETTAAPTLPISHHSSSTSGLKSTNTFLTDLNPSKSLPMTSQATKSQFTSTLETTAAPKSTSEIIFSTPGASSPASTSTKSQLTTLLDPFSPTFSVDWSQMAPITSATVKSQFKSSTASTSGLLSNPFSTNSDSEYSKFATTSATTKSQFAFTTTAAPKTTSEITFSTSGISSPASTSTKSQLTTSSDPFLSVGRSHVKSTSSATAKSQLNPAISLKISKSTNPFSTDLTASTLGVTPTKSVSKSQSTVSSTSGTNSPDGFSVFSSTKPQLKSKTASDFWTRELATTSKFPSVTSATKSRTTPDTTSATKSQFHHSSATSRSQMRSTTFETKPEAEVDTAESVASSVPPRPPTKKKSSCIIS